MLNPGHPFRVLAKTISVGSNSVLGNCAEQEEREMDRKKVTGFMHPTSSKSTRAYLPQNIQTWVHHQNKVHQIKCKVGFESKG